jgi:hypothetical protein
MGWEFRHGKRVYVRKVRTGKHVRSIYFGFGERAEAAAREDKEHRYKRRSRRPPGTQPAPARRLSAGAEGEPESSAPRPAEAAPAAAPACACPTSHASAYCLPDRQAYADDFLNRDDTGARLGPAWVVSSADGSSDKLLAAWRERKAQHEVWLAEQKRLGEEYLEQLRREAARNVALAPPPPEVNVAPAETPTKEAKSDDETSDVERWKKYTMLRRETPRQYRTLK